MCAGPMCGAPLSTKQKDQRMAAREWCVKEEAVVLKEECVVTNKVAPWALNRPRQGPQGKLQFSFSTVTGCLHLCPDCNDTTTLTSS